MKETYYDKDNINRKAGELLSIANKYTGNKQLADFPGKPALLVLDMQDYFLSPRSHAFVPSAAAIIPRIISLVNAFDRINSPVIFTRHINTKENAQMMDRWWSSPLIGEGPLSEISDLLRGYAHDIIIKPQYDAFHNTGLEKRLIDSDIRTVIITGVMTHLCCETTARSAFVRGFNVIVPPDATATYNFELHRSSTINLSHGFALPATVQNLISHLDIYHLEKKHLEKKHGV